MLGDKRRFPIMLVVPNVDNLRSWATHKGIPEEPIEQLVARSEIQEKMDREVRKTLRDLAHFEMPKKLLLIARDFTIESGELTPKMSVKRHVVERNYRDQIEKLYAEPAPQAQPDPV
jgi:long-chain acyl-CoA synthetase